MKKILFILTFCFISISLADSGMTLEKCSEQSELAGMIMKMRQDDAPIAEVFVLNAKAENKERVDLLNSLTTYAYSYNWTKFNSYTNQKNEILDFQNEIFLACFDKIDQ